MGKMKGFKNYISEKKGGAAAGSLEVITTSLEDAREYALSKLPDLDKDIPDFDK